MGRSAEAAAEDEQRGALAFRSVDGCTKAMCPSFAHATCFTHSAIMDLCPSVALLPRNFDLCKYSYHELAYLHGLDKPKYPVPAIREHFEFGFQHKYGKVYVVLLHVKQGRYDDGDNAQHHR